MTKILNDKDFWKKTAELALPVAVQNMLTSSFTLVDTLLVSSLGDISLAAVGMAGQWGWLMNMIIFGICSATGVFVSQYWGVKDKKNIHVTMGIALIISLAVSAVFFALSFFAPNSVIHLFNSNKAVIDEGSKYLVIIAFSYPAVAITNILSVVLRSTEKVRLPMYISAITTMLNIGLDYCLIFGNLGFKEMGIGGAALATLISAWVGVFALILLSLADKNIIIAPVKEVFSIRKRNVTAFAKKAIPVILNESLWGGGTFLYTLIFANMGYEYYAAITILKSFENIEYVFFIGLCNASAVMIGKSVGKGEIERGITDAKRFMIIVPSASVIIGIIAIIFRVPLVNIFDMGNNISQLTITTAIQLIVIYSVELPLRTFGYTMIVGVLRAGGDTLSAAKYDLASLWLFSLPATVIAAYVLKLPFIWCYIVMFIFEDYIKLFLTLRRYKSKKWIIPVTEEGKAGLEKYLSANTEKVKSYD
ncbi:MAG: MATE family efflux transporter [Eubacterium sp.]|nr:MATE family efflux transporter [Eubacterium sp.]